MNSPTHRARCFIERDPGLPLARRAAAEGLGAFLLVLAASGGAALTARSAAPEVVLACATAVGGALVGLIVALGPISGGHFNPLITGSQWLAGEHSGRCALAYVLAQLAGAALGGLAAKAVDGSLAVPPSVGTTATLATSELLASLGLMAIVLGCSRGGQDKTGPFAVGAWLTAAIVATPSGSLANPAVTAAAALTGAPLALPVGTAAAYAAAQAAGALLALLAIGFVAPRLAGQDFNAFDKDDAS